MITSAEIEAVARAACRAAGKDPDEVVHRHDISQCYERVPQWFDYADRAIEAVKGAGK